MAHADDTLTQKALAVLGACLTGKGTMGSLPFDASWVPIPRKGALTDRFFAMELEGMEIENQDTIKYDKGEFQDIELFPFRKMMLLEADRDAVSFIGSDILDLSRTCTFTFTYESPFDGIVEKYADNYPERKEKNNADVFLFAKDAAGFPADFISVTTMLDKSAKPLSGAVLQVRAQATLKR